MRLQYESRCVPQLQEMSKAPKHTTFTFWSADYLIWKPKITEDYGRLWEMEWRFRRAKAE